MLPWAEIGGIGAFALILVLCIVLLIRKSEGGAKQEVRADVAEKSLEAQAKFRAGKADAHRESRDAKREWLRNRKG